MNRALLLVLLALAALHCCLADGTAGDDDVDRKRHKRPWFCHRRDCPEFKTVRPAPHPCLFLVNNAHGVPCLVLYPVTPCASSWHCLAHSFVHPLHASCHVPPCLPSPAGRSERSRTTPSAATSAAPGLSAACSMVRVQGSLGRGDRLICLPCPSPPAQLSTLPWCAVASCSFPVFSSARHVGRHATAGRANRPYGRSLRCCSLHARWRDAGQRTRAVLRARERRVG